LVPFGILVWSGLNSCSSTRQLAVQSPEIVLDNYLSYHTPISSASKLKLWINLQTGEKARTELFVYSRTAEEYSFYLKDFWGRDLMTALIRKDSLIVFYPQENKYLEASIEDFTRSDYWLWQISPLTLLKAVDGTLLNRQARINFVGQNNGSYEYLLSDNQHQMLLSLSLKNNSLNRILLYESSGEVLAEIQWEDVRPYNDYLRPRRIKIKMGNIKDEIKLGIMEEEFDLELNQKYFDLSIPPNAQRISLN
jgi:hypothetical protein